MSWSKSGPGGPRGYHHGNLKEALIRAALELIAQKGPAGFTFAEAARWGHPPRYWNHRSVARWQEKMELMQSKIDRMRDRMESSGGGWWGGPPSSGNRAFDEYRAETLRRLEEEQREFKEFLQRLRQAKDKAEFDMFMAERRNRNDRADTAQPQG